MATKNFLQSKRDRNFLELTIEKEEKKKKKLQNDKIEKNFEISEKIENFPQNQKNSTTTQNPIINQSLLPEKEMKYTLKININKKKEQKVKELLKKKYHNEQNSRIKSYTSKREKMMKKGFNFVEKGSFEKTLQLYTNNNSKKENNENNSKILSFVKPKFSSAPLQLKASNIIPSIEPWDVEFLPSGMNNFLPPEKNGKDLKLSDFLSYFNKLPNFSQILDKKLNFYIHHPVPIKSEYLEKENKIQLPVYLTTRERKKFRKIKKMEKIKDEQEKIKFGLIKPKPVKITYKNFMQIFKDESIADPSLIEQKVKQAYEERYNKMIEQNAKNALTKEQKREKRKRKLEKDSKKECRGCLIRIRKLKCNLNRYKIQKNGQQLYLTGICLMNRPGEINSLLYFEGGPLAVQKMKNLITKRIKWNLTEKIENSDKNFEIMWEGILKQRNCEDWKIHEIKSEADAIKLLQPRKMENMWTLVK